MFRKAVEPWLTCWVLFAKKCNSVKEWEKWEMRESYFTALLAHR